MGGGYFLYFVKFLKVFSLIVIVDVIIETITGYNPFFEFLMNTGAYDKDSFRAIEEIRFGVKRAQSIFPMHTQLAGFALLAYSLFAFLYYQVSKRMFKYNILAWVLLVCLFLTGARSAILGAVVSLMMLVNKSSLKKMNKGKIIIMIILLSTLGATYFSSVMDSFTDTTSVGGSNTEMRSTQFEIALLYFLKSPWIGNGLAYTWNTALVDYPDLLGAESVWFPYMIDQGILGCVAWLSFSACAGLYFWRNEMKSCFWLLLGWVVFNTMSSVPGITNLFFCNIVFVMVASKLKINEKKNENKRMFVLA